MSKLLVCIAVLCVQSVSMIFGEDTPDNNYNFTSYIKVCSKSNPDLNKCIVENAQYAIPFVAKGDKKLNIPKLSPYLKIDRITFEPSSQLILNFTNLKIYGFNNTIITSAKADPEKKTLQVSALIPKQEQRLHYTAKGRILLLPVEGDGPGLIIFHNAKYTYTLEYDKIVKDGQNYLKYKNSKLDFEPESSEFNFENLFNGNKQLGDQINQVVNENSKVIINDFGKPITETVKLVIDNIVIGMLESGPHEDLYRP